MGSKFNYYLTRTCLDISDRLSNTVDSVSKGKRAQILASGSGTIGEMVESKILKSRMGQRISAGLTNLYALVENKGAAFSDDEIVDGNDDYPDLDG